MIRVFQSFWHSIIRAIPTYVHLPFQALASPFWPHPLKSGGTRVCAHGQTNSSQCDGFKVFYRLFSALWKWPITKCTWCVILKSSLGLFVCWHFDIGDKSRRNCRIWYIQALELKVLHEISNSLWNINDSGIHYSENNPLVSLLYRTYEKAILSKNQLM